MADDAPSNLQDIDYNAELQASTIGTVERMKAIIHVLEAPMGVLKAQNIDEEHLGELLDELQDLVVSSVDMSSEFHSAGGLVPILNCLKTFDAGLRARAANVVAKLVWGSQRSQQLVMEANGFEALFDVFSSDPDVVTRTNALDAIFSLIRNNKAAITSFRDANGYEALIDPLTCQDVCYQRKALDLIYLILAEDSGERKTMHRLEYPRMMAILGNSGDAKVRESALWGLLKLADLRKAVIGNHIKYDFGEKMKPLLEERIAHICSMSDDEFKESKTERMLVDTLWTTCFDESSDLWQEEFERALRDLELERFGSPVRPFDFDQAFGEDTDSMG